MGIYQGIYDLIVQHVYGGTLPADGNLVATLLSTCAVVFLCALPFVVTWRFIKILAGD